jgi:hypothetical protein
MLISQKQRKLKQAKEDLVILKKLKLISTPDSYERRRLGQSIKAKQHEINRLEKNHVKNEFR